MKSGIVASAFLCAMLLTAATAQAATANFQGNCNGSTLSCSFDSLRPAGSPSSCSPSFIWKETWDFGDNNTLFTGNTLVNHTYANNSSVLVQLSVWCYDGTSASTSRVVCFSVGVPGCIGPNVGWN
jgi:hypothetical protein